MDKECKTSESGVNAEMAQSVAHLIGSEEVTGSIPVFSTIIYNLLNGFEMVKALEEYK